MSLYWPQFRTQQHLRLASLFVLIFAVLPNVLYLGHLPLPGLSNEPEHIHTPAQAQEHTEHCHLGPSSCSDQPSLSGVWWLAGSSNLVLPSGPWLRIVLPDNPATLDGPASVLKPPPRSL